MNIHNKHQQQLPSANNHHQQQLISNNNNNNNNNGSPFLCNICKKTFHKASSLNTHMITHTSKLYCYACNISFDDDAIMYAQHMQMVHSVAMTKDLISRTKTNLEKNETNMNQQEESDDQQPMNARLMEVFQVQSTSVEKGQIPKLKITIKKEPIIKQEPKDDEGGNESDSSTSSSSSSNSSSSSSSSGSSSSSTSKNSIDARSDNNKNINNH